MKNLLTVLFVIILPLITFCQARIVFNGANILITNNANLVIDNPAPDAITVNTSGGLISEGTSNSLIWNIGANAASYTIPFISGSNNIPISFTTSGGAGNGMFTLSTYAGPDWKNSNYLPPTVTNVDRDGMDNSSHVIDRFWQINASGYTTNPSLSNLVFTYTDDEWNETGNNIIEANLTAQSWNDIAGIWITPVGTNNSSTNQVTVPIVTSSNLNNWWTLADDNYALPLTLISFTAEKQNENALLKWSVAGQINVKYYEVQRSINAVDFLPVAKVNAIGNGNYSYTDALNNINANTIYYRLRMADIDGKFSYSPVRYISLSGYNNELIQVFPNPATALAIIRFGAVTEGAYQLSVFNAEGKEILVQKIEVTPNSTFYFQRNNMAAGTYFFKITGKNIKEAFTILFN